MESINQRIVQERYTDASVMLQYFNNPSAKLENKLNVRIFCSNLPSRIQRDEEFTRITIIRSYFESRTRIYSSRKEIATSNRGIDANTPEFPFT